MKTLLYFEKVPFKDYLKERISSEDQFEFFITSGPECDLEVEVDINNLMFTIKKERCVEYNCYLEENSTLEIFTTKVDGYKDRDGIKFGLRTKRKPEDIFQQESLRDILGIAVFLKVDDDNQFNIIQSLLEENGYSFYRKKMNFRKFLYKVSKDYGYYVISSEYGFLTSK